MTLPLDKPIKRRMKLRKSEKEWCWVNFQYEAIPTFCFICGLIGHAERYCDEIFDKPVEMIDKPYGSWLRADPRRKTHTIGSKWLRQGGSSQASYSGDKGAVNTDRENAVNYALVQQTSKNSGSDQNGNMLFQGENVGANEGTKQLAIQDNLYQINTQIQNEDLEGKSHGPENLEIRIADPKRRRVDQATDIQITQVTDMEVQVSSSEVSKNEAMAGVATQPRQSL